IVLQKADELSEVNLELARSNSELDSFAYIASHDLKEPLRGIHNYSSFLIEDYAEQLDEAGVSKLETLMRLTQRMEDLINSLLHYSRLGRTTISIQSVDLSRLLDNVIEMLNMSQPLTVEFRMPRSLPRLNCDRTQVTELLTNLITNAIKYNDKPSRWIEIGYLDPSEGDAPPAAQKYLDSSEQPTVFYVRDNGIGIRPQHLDTIFKIFKRLHPARRYGGGTGAGLTIAKKIVERHGGQIWVDSTYGEGSTFYFTLQG
ncbi:MAG: cyanobacterial phytochrome A, partial [Leptolyngbya sp. SIO4C1]|nr:cyanobacterial phytochrome A [Leptolyngbya sp. SIO4C1]